MIKPKYIKYKVTDMFGQINVGDIINAVLITKDTDRSIGLIYHPIVPNECGNFEICKYIEDEDVWVSINKDNYINCDSKKLQLDLFGKKFKFKRVFTKE